VSFRTPADAIAHRIGLLPEDRKAQGFVGGFTIARNIALPHGRRLAPYGFLRDGCEATMAQPLVNDLRIKGTATQPVRLLSGGNQQKVVLAKWLALRPRVIVFDEPTQGVDVRAKAEIHRLIRTLAEEGTAVVMISSDMDEIVAESDRVAVMHDGRITGILPRSRCTPESIMQLAVA
jgi:ribose transport system ATP-binding protein